MNKLKKIVAVLIAATTISALSISAFAVDYNHPSFDFNLSANNSQHSYLAKKQDNLDNAKANCKAGNIDSKAYVWLSVKNSNYIQVSNEEKATGANNTIYTMYYYAGQYKEGNYYCLNARTETYGAYVSGKWDP